MKYTPLTILACALLVQIGTAHAQCSDKCAAPVEPYRFVDNNNGTISDTCTGLQWEKKTAPGTGGLHDVNNQYSWSATGNPPNGSVFTVFLYGLNQDQITFQDHAPITGCFAKHCDWRLPTYTELLSIVERRVCLDSTQRPDGHPCIDPKFGPTQPNAFQGPGATAYWSATTYANDNTASVNVDFYNGFIVGGAKASIPDYARAVRCGDIILRP